MWASLVLASCRSAQPRTLSALVSIDRVPEPVLARWCWINSLCVEGGDRTKNVAFVRTDAACQLSSRISKFLALTLRRNKSHAWHGRSVCGGTASQPPTIRRHPTQPGVLQSPPPFITAATVRRRSRLHRLASAEGNASSTQAVGGKRKRGEDKAREE